MLLGIKKSLFVKIKISYHLLRVRYLQAGHLPVRVLLLPAVAHRPAPAAPKGHTSGRIPGRVQLPQLSKYLIFRDKVEQL